MLVKTINFLSPFPWILVSGKSVFFAIIIDVEFDAEPPGSVMPPAYGPSKPKRFAKRSAVSRSMMVRAGETIFFSPSQTGCFFLWQ
jgi:hypothetical protein